MKFLLCTLAIVYMLFAQAPYPVESNVYAGAKHDAEVDAEFHTNDIQWLACGFLGSFIGVGAAYIMKSEPPQERLLGKPTGYITIYTMVYQRHARALQLKNSLIGCTISATLASCIGAVLVYQECMESDPCSPIVLF